MIPIHQLGGRLGNRMFQLAYIYAQEKRGAVKDTWLQDPAYFDEFREEIMRWYGEGIERRSEVSIHVRHGDYMHDPAFYVLSRTDYYEKAIALFPNDRFLVCSDDPEWCKRQWGADPRFTIREGGDEIDDLNQMAGCHSNIIANSSFSWWAGYLNPNPQKRVVYPRAWHTDGVQRVAFPAGWEPI